MYKITDNTNFLKNDIKNRTYYLDDLIKTYDLDFEKIKLDEKSNKDIFI